MQLQPFQGQRDIDNNRVPAIKARFQQSIADTGTLYFDTPVVLVEGANINVVLMSKSNEKVFKAIFDGQHRVKALKQILMQHPQQADVDVPVYVHRVHSMHDAHSIQHNLFKQKPVDLYDQAKDRTEPNLMDVLTSFQERLKQSYPNVSTLFKTGRYGDPNRSPLRMHLMTDELVHSIKNSPNVDRWIQANITAEAFTEAFLNIIQQCTTKCQTQQANHQMTTKHLQTLQSKQKKYGNVLFLSYFYYKRYPALVSELENALALVDVGCE